MVITIIPGVDAGPDTIVCSGVDTIQLNGTVENALGGQWSSSGAGPFLPNDSALNAQYVLTAADIALGFVNFVLTTLDTGICPSGTDSMSLTIQPPSAVSAVLIQ